MRKIVFLVFGMILVFSTATMAQNSPKWAVAQKKRNARLLKQLMSQEQAQQWQKKAIEFKKKRNEIWARLKNAKLDLQLLLGEQRVPDEKAVDKKLKEINELSFALQKLNYEEQIALRKLLTDDQWNRWLQMKKKAAFGFRQKSKRK